MTAVVESELYRPTKWPQRHEQTHYWACFAAGGLHDTYTAFDRALNPLVANAINDDIIITESQLEADPILAVTFEASNFGGRKRRGVGTGVQASTQVSAEIGKTDPLRASYQLFASQSFAKFGFTLRRHQDQFFATLLKALKITTHMA